MTLTLVAAATGIGARTVGADEMIRPQNARSLRAAKSTAVRVRGARVAYANYMAIRRDFPAVKNLSDAQIRQWVLKNFAYINQMQRNLDGIRNSPIPIDAADVRADYRPGAYGRAGVMEATHPETGETIGLVDLKGLGHWLESNTAKQAELFRAANGDSNLNNAIRTKDHSDGLMTLGEGITEIIKQQAAQRLFDIHNATNPGESLQTVENYFVIELPFDILKDGTTQERAALIGRQALHERGKPNFGPKIPGARHRMVESGGLDQGSLLESLIDFGTVKIMDERLKSTFGEQRDPQSSNAWSFSHDAAHAFANSAGEGDLSIVEGHIKTMLQPIEAAWKKAAAADMPENWRLRADEQVAAIRDSARADEASKIVDELLKRSNPDEREVTLRKLMLAELSPEAARKIVGKLSTETAATFGEVYKKLSIPTPNLDWAIVNGRSARAQEFLQLAVTRRSTAIKGAADQVEMVRALDHPNPKIVQGMIFNLSKNATADELFALGRAAPTESAARGLSEALIGLASRNTHPDLPAEIARYLIGATESTDLTELRFAGELHAKFIKRHRGYKVALEERGAPEAYMAPLCALQGAKK